MNVATLSPGKRIHPAPADLPAALRTIVDYRKSGLSLNHIVGCPLDCAYCVRHLFSNFDMKRPHLVVSDEEAVTTLLAHWAFKPHVTPLQLLNRATDPFLPGVKDHLFAVLEALDAEGLTNLVLVITRWKVRSEDVARLNAMRNLRVTVLVTWSGIDDPRIEPVDSGIAERSLQTLRQGRGRTRSILYWRPLVAGLNDNDAQLARARKIAQIADATVFTGLFFRSQIQAYLRSIGAEDLYAEAARRKILPRTVEERALRALQGLPAFRKTSCGVAFVHGVADYNGHYGIRELCDICPAGQRARCAAAHQRPEAAAVSRIAEIAGLDPSSIGLDDRRIEVAGSTEQQRYFMQHGLNYQVHDQAHPHWTDRHGRAEEGWA